MICFGFRIVHGLLGLGRTRKFVWFLEKNEAKLNRVLRTRFLYDRTRVRLTEFDAYVDQVSTSAKNRVSYA